jgi:hypothetical protein
VAQVLVSIYNCGAGYAEGKLLQYRQVLKKHAQQLMVTASHRVAQATGQGFMN